MASSASEIILSCNAIRGNLLPFVLYFTRTADFRNCWGLDGTRGSYTALVTEVQLCILRGELDVPQKMSARPRRPACRRLLVFFWRNSPAGLIAQPLGNSAHKGVEIGTSRVFGSMQNANTDSVSEIVPDVARIFLKL